MIALVLLLLAPAARAGTVSTATVMFDDQFPDPASRDQGGVGSCHAFTTVSLMEAALWRKHKKRYWLSEADLFVQKVVEDPAYYAKARTALGANAAYKFLEGGSPYDDCEFARTKGVAFAEHAEWGAFEKKYLAWKKERQKEVETGRSQVKMTGGALEDIKKDYESIAASERNGSDRLAQVSRVHLQRVETKTGGMHVENVRNFQGFLDQVAGRTKREAEGRLLGDVSVLEDDRKEVVRLAAGFKTIKLDFPYKLPPKSAVDPDAACRELGAKAKAGLLAALKKKVPVALSMDIGGLPEWGQRGNFGSAWHAFTITGYTLDVSGALTLHSRNSWGGLNPDVPETRFCRIMRVTAVKTASE